MIQYTIAEDEGTEEDFQNKDLQHMIEYLANTVEGILPEVNLSLVADQNKNRIRVTFDFEKEENIGLLIGPDFRVVNSILELMRFQQYCRHNRFIEFHINKRDGTTQVVRNKKVFLKKETA